MITKRPEKMPKRGLEPLEPQHPCEYRLLKLARLPVCHRDLAWDSHVKVIILTTALWLSKRNLVKKMIKENPAIAKKAEGGADLGGNTTPWGVAAGKGDKEIVELLLKAGAPVNAVTHGPAAGDMTALSNAVPAKQFAIAEILCKAGA